jgi:iron complex outermembrane recepter protein
MFKRTQISSCALVALGSILMVPAAAQTAEPQRIEVTGSRIRSISADSPSPLQILTSEDIAASGATNVQELLLKSPVMGNPAFSRTNSNFATASAGVSSIDLRNLGTARTLVLINGRRVVGGVPGSTAVDLNTIPTEFIERVEVLTGGASALYGSDAVAGVVNIIFKKNFDGVVLDVQYGASADGDDTRKKASMTFGASSANGKSSLMGHLAVSKQGAVFSRDRDASAVDQASRGAFVTGDPADFFDPVRPFFSSFAPQGRFFYGPLRPAAGNTQASRTFDAQGNLIPFSTNGPAGDGVGATGFNRSDFRTIAIPTNRLLFSSKGEHAVAENHTAFFEGTYAGTQTRTKLEPFPMDSQDPYPVTGKVPAEFLVNGSLVRNPLIPQSLYNLLTDTDGDGVRDYFFTRRLSEVGNRGNTADRDFFRGLGGLKGDLTKDWQYELFVAYGTTKESQVSSGQINVQNFRNALEAHPDVQDVDNDGNLTEVICRNADARAQGCVPINVFGFNSISPAAGAYVSAPGLLSTFTSQKLGGFSLSGEPFVLPAGPVGVAIGGEYRKEFSRSEFDALQQAGLNAGNAIPRTEGAYTVREMFLETKLPLLKGSPFAKQLQALFAVRSGDYSTVGSTLSWNAGLEWAVNSDVRFRLTRSLSTRAPDINELYSPPSQTFPTGLSDPCLNVTNVSTGTTAERCRADSGVQANINANVSTANPNGIFALSQPDLQGVSGFNLGNPNLGEEKGRSLTLGLVITPTSVPALRNFTFTADYFKISIADAILTTPRQFILDQCYSGDTSFCSLITRRPNPLGANSAGSLSFINAPTSNSGGFETEGVDLTAAFADKVGPGRLSTRLAYTYLKSGSQTPAPGSDKDHFAGEIGAARNRFTLNVGYDVGDFGVRTTTTYIGKSALDDQFLAGFTDANDNPLGRSAITVPAKTYVDFQLTYNVQKRTQVYFGMDNAFGTKAPPIITGLPNNVTGAETDSGVYDAIGRRYYFGVRASF